jgi:PAS domain S-box-containing protein
MQSFLALSASMFLEAVPDAMLLVDERGRIALSNAQAERLFGYDRDELAGRGIEMLVPERFRDRHVGHREGYVDDPHRRPMGAGLELYGRRKDGTEFPVEISLAPIYVDEGLLVVSAIRDISDRIRIQHVLEERNRELERANAAKDRFLASMSHELRTPLNAIIGFTGTMLMKLPGPLNADQEQQLQTIQSSARHLLSLINDILDLAKIESGKIELHFEPVDVCDVADEVIASLRPLAEGNGLEFQRTFRSDPLILQADRRVLRQILINLTSNAIKYTPKGGVRIDFAKRTNDGRTWVDVHVADTGIGIGEEDRKKLFAPFEQIDQSTTRRFGGTGLGLYLSSKLASLLKGDIHFVSEVGRGSTFTLSLPV